MTVVSFILIHAVGYTQWEIDNGPNPVHVQAVDDGGTIGRMAFMFGKAK